ncbi:hypothetical protein MPSI1_001478 [Malassezia psittaci]|uniref:UspA domain-containing protein n=1 Tax=Malassezia psittaci TaxID=1821823 RepID=A0AAF0F4Y1_9BASI|nr:hypothetical protein MPSI1_001478 [Malassezia psittaci]
MSTPTNSTDQGFFGVQQSQTSSSGDVTPGGQVHQIAQTPVLESGNPFDKTSIPSEARQQQIVGVPGERLPEEKSKVLLALDGTEAGDKAFNYLLTNKTIAQGSHIFLTTVLPANVLGGPWVSGPLSIDTKKQNELLRQLRMQAVERMAPYKAQLKDKGFNVTMHVLHGDARASLLKVINYHKVDMVLIHSPVPVLVIK